jgi:hypothetical protein
VETVLLATGLHGSVAQLVLGALAVNAMLAVVAVVLTFRRPVPA